MRTILDSALWPFLGVLMGTVTAVLVAYIQRKPTEVQLGQYAFTQIQELAAQYKSDLSDMRAQRAEALKVEEALRANLILARTEIEALRDQLADAKHELKQARIEIQTLRQQIANATGQTPPPIDLTGL